MHLSSFILLFSYRTALILIFLLCCEVPFGKAMDKEHLELELGQWDPSISRPYSSSRGATGGTIGS
ncbi:hypothetical protein KFK09_018868 [Dendrobium nobile]|uniref:Uncharacterized protein n=1 Tax=Dendrobium nobile TaxID=94219 RepID=A0A8T3AY98_DENNO|nr:hypothetical protein KFK09_018868 [Dendrobium nobile]